ncbi:STAS domain-containing protein [Pseudonocardia nigra]|uniref:STAS domain-containing protein n=1 Tax=Pseudonocardia nigra TaxID=1921578 RepID=UPI001C5DB9CD|nr:STAS domain-containing protein [Pseudonocardia nigra]
MQEAPRDAAGVFPLVIDVVAEPPRATVRVSGELDLFTAPALERRLDALRGAGCRHVDLDMAGVTFLAAAGLTVLARADRDYRAVPGRVLLAGTTRACRRLLALSGLAGMLRTR